MGKMEQALRAEISRLARKELRAECGPIKKELRELKRHVKKLSAAAGKPTTAPAEPARPPQRTARRLDIPREDAHNAPARWNGRGFC